MDNIKSVHISNIDTIKNIKKDVNILVEIYNHIEIVKEKENYKDIVIRQTTSTTFLDNNVLKIKCSVIYNWSDSEGEWNIYNRNLNYKLFDLIM